MMRLKRAMRGVSSGFSLIWLATKICAAETVETDLCVYGGTSGGVAAAVQAARMGKTVALVEFGRHLGGMSSGGLSQTDIGNKGAIGGISREFYQRIGRHYSKDEAWTFEPSIAERTFNEMVNEARVTVYFQQRLAAVTKKGKRIVDIRMESGNVFRARMFIDATYEGDLMAKAKVSFHVGREANSVYHETLNGVRALTPKHQFIVPVDPYVTPSRRASGLLPFIQAGAGGKPGEGDRRVQTYNFRMCLTQNPTNTVPIRPPADYDPARYELLARYLESLGAAGKTPKLGELMHIQMMPGGKTDINNNGGFSTDYIGANYEYPEANYARRAKIWKAHENYTRGFFHFLASSPRVAESIRAEMQTWGLCRDEFVDTGGWPHQLYVREARRMISDCVMTEHRCRGTVKASDSIGLAAYTMDSHNCQRLVKNGAVENEGDVQVGGFPPYPIAYGSIVPKASECENLLVPVCLSSSHIAYGSIRMEPVFMVLGQSAATAAALAIDANIPAQKVDIHKLQARLLADKQVLEWKGNPTADAATKAAYVDPKSLPGIVLDDTDGATVGRWTPSASASARRVGTGYVHDGNADKGQLAITYAPDIPAPGDYEVFLISPPHENRASNVPVAISIGGTVVNAVKVNQRLKENNGFASLGKYRLPKGKHTAITVSNHGTDGYVVADGVQLIPVTQ